LKKEKGMNKFKHLLFAAARLPVANRTVSPRCWLIALIITTLLGSGVTVRAAETVRFKGTGEGSRQIIITPLLSIIASFDAEGEFTHFGTSTIHADMLFLPNLNDTLHGTGSLTFTVADGDTAEMDVEGDLNTTTGRIVGTFTITGGSGKFVNATGHGTFDGNEDAQGNFKVTLTGVITY
jgi:hypothetical protein